MVYFGKKQKLMLTLIISSQEDNFHGRNFVLTLYFKQIAIYLTYNEKFQCAVNENMFKRVIRTEEPAAPSRCS